MTTVTVSACAGETDPNREPMKAIFDAGFTAEKFKHATFYDVPGLGHRSPGGEWFEKAIEAHDPAAIWLPADPALNGLRTDPRYGALLRKMNLKTA